MRRTPPWLRATAAVCAGVVFAAAGVLKLLDPSQFSDEIAAYRLIDGHAAAALAVYLPWLELSAGLTLLWPRTRRTAAVLLAGVLVIFVVAQGSAWVRDIDPGCGCFGFDWGLSPLWIILRDAFLMALLILASRS